MHNVLDVCEFATKTTTINYTVKNLVNKKITTMQL